ncbi:MAG TPA: caspase family protein [Blastocatellia bacterium]
MRIFEGRRYIYQIRFLSISVILLNSIYLAPMVPSLARGSSHEQPKPKRHALLVGINKYDPVPEYVRGTEESHHNPEVSGPPRRSAFQDLHGAANDVKAMQAVLAKYGFEDTDVKVLMDTDATRDHILTDFQKCLIDAVSPGDVCLFYYSGHGSRVRNSLGDPKGYDESIVPTDSNLGAPDIRDKEIARLCLKAIQKHITITVIADSCFSGTIGRGGDQSGIRGVPWDETDVHEAPGFTVPPEDIGALILSASQDFEPAQEHDRDRACRGDFSFALQKVLEDPASITESSEQIYQRVVSLMRADRDWQEPVLGGNLARHKGTLFDATPVRSPRPTAAVISVGSGEVELNGGVDQGFGIDTELIAARAAPDAKPVRLQVKEMEGPPKCKAIITQGKESDIKPGDQFVLDRWGAQPSEQLRVWIPPAASPFDLDSICKRLKALRDENSARWSDDPATADNVRLLWRDAAGWVTSDDGGARGNRPEPALSQLAAADARGATFVSLPPAKALSALLKFGPGSDFESISIVNSPAEANYLLEGRLTGQGVEYAWIRSEAPGKGTERGGDPWPVRSDWIGVTADPDSITTAGNRLTDAAIALARVNGWLTIQGPGQIFPYRVALRETGTTQLIQGSKVYEGRRYDLLLVPDAALFRKLAESDQRAQRRRIYVFGIDAFGDSNLLFPQGNVENLLPEHPDKIDVGKPPTEPILLGQTGGLQMIPPFGLDTYIMLASDQSITDPSVLQFTGGRTRSAPRGDETAFGRLVYGLESGTRAARNSEPTDWSIDRMFLRSEPQTADH